MKYRVLPCTALGKSQGALGDFGDLFTLNLFGQFSSFNRGQRWSGKTTTRRNVSYNKVNQFQIVCLSILFFYFSVLNFLISEYKLNSENFLYNWNYDTTNKNSMMSTIYIDFGNYLSIQLSGGSVSPTNVDNPNNLEPDQEDKTFDCFSTIQVFHIPQTVERVRRLLEELTKFKVYPITEATLQMVCYDSQCGFYTSSIRMKKPHIPNLKLHYGNDFEDIHEELIQKLEEKDSNGITFLHGPPGTGKTSYLRYLINEIKDKPLIYVPPGSC